jgi:hypothetical protein
MPTRFVCPYTSAMMEYGQNHDIISDVLMSLGYSLKDDCMLETSAVNPFASHRVTSIEQLESLYDAPAPRALI